MNVSPGCGQLRPRILSARANAGVKVDEMTRNNCACRGLIVTLSTVCVALACSSSATAQQFVDQTATRFPAEPVPGGEYTNQIAVGDIDGDTDLDLIFSNGGGFSTAGAPQQLRIYINNGAGVFSDGSAARVPGALYLARGVELGDIDGDNDLDMIVAQDFNRQPQLWINDGSGFFTNVTLTQMPVMLLSSSRGQFADVDNDGDLDIYLVHGGAVNRFGTDRGKLLINNGSGTFVDDTVARTPNETVIEPMDCIFGDVDGNFTLDLIIASRRFTAATTNAKRYMNNGSGVFTGAAMPSTMRNYSFDLGDFDGDGDFDLLGANAHPTSGNSELVARNGTNGTTTGVFAPLAALVSSTIDDNDSKFFDYDNDGDMDLIIASLGSTERIYNNSGTGTYALVGGLITAVSDATMDVEVADVDSDGRLDVITAQGESGSFVNRIYMNLTGPVDTRAPRIVKTEQIPDSLSADGPFIVRAVVHDDMTSDRGFHDKGVVLTYSISGAAGPVEVAMKWMGNSMWRAELPTAPTGSVIDYFVTATDWAGNVGVGPTLQLDILWPPCPADLNGDHTVGVPDLLGVINAWGQSVQTHIVELNGTSFTPNLVNAKSGDTIQWNWLGGGSHSITSGTGCTGDGRFNQLISSGSWFYVIPSDFAGTIPYYCIPHCAFGMTADINVVPFAGDVNGSGSVGTPDLLAVINAWGNCPVK